MKNVIMILIVVAALGGAAYVMQGKLGMGEEAMSERISELQLDARGLRAGGNFDQAIPLMEEAVELSRKVDGDEPTNRTCSTMLRLSADYVEAGRYSNAIVLLEELIPLWERVAGPENSDLFRARRLLDRARAGASGG